MQTDFKQRLAQGVLLKGTIVTLACPSVAELLARSGLDWLFVDGEHGPLSTGDIQALLQAAQPYCPCVVRVAANDEVNIKQALDVGADGVVAPMVNDADTAARVVAWAKYPPEGRRSVGIARAQGYGRTFGDYVSRANHATVVIIQVEHADAVANLTSILNVPGIDAVFVGPYDLSASMGKPGQINANDVQEQLRIVRQTCLERKMPLGIFGINARAVSAYIEQGYSLIALGIDTLLLSQAIDQELEILNKEMATHP